MDYSFIAVVHVPNLWLNEFDISVLIVQLSEFISFICGVIGVI